MSGTSLDGLDLALCRFTILDGHWQYELLKAETVAYSDVQETTIRNLPYTSAESFWKGQVLFSHFCGETVRKFIAASGEKPSLISSHGHTIFHNPSEGYTCQIGMGEIMVTYTECPWVMDFRTRDVARGGQGAPLVPMGEKVLFGADKMFLNLGGISNISSGESAFDVCPFNQILNLLAAEYQPGLAFDAEGKIAASGVLHPDFLSKLNNLDFYQISGPKSLGREWVEQTFLPLIHAEKGITSIPDLLHTVCVHFSKQIARALIRNAGDRKEVLVTGGGAFNSFFTDLLQQHLKGNGISLILPDANLIQYKEAVIFACLGLLSALRQENIYPSITGASMPSISGSFHFPEGYSTVLI